MTGDRHVRPDRVWPDLLAMPAVIGAMLLMLLTLPVTLPISLLLGWSDRRHLRAVTAVTRCARCGALLGPDAPEVSDAAHMAALADMQRRHPNHLVHLARRSQARCRTCGADHVWDGKRRTLQLLLDPADAHHDYAAEQVPKQAKERR